MSPRLWRACGLALLLVFVQHLALTHALEHLARDNLHAVAGDDAADCPQCLVLGGLHGGAPAAVGDILPLAASAYRRGFIPAAAPARRPTSAYAIRAPPENWG